VKRSARTFALVATLLALVVGATACSPGRANGTFAIRVDGQELSERELLRELGQFLDNPGAAEVLDIQGATGNVPIVVSSAWMTQYVRDVLVRGELRRRGAAISADDRRSAEEAISQFFGREAWTVFADWFTERIVERQARLFALERALVRPVTEAQARAEYEARKDLLTQQACASHLLVPTEVEAQGAKARIDAGEEFAAVAGEVSIDQGSAVNGGALGCVDRGTFVAPFDEAVWTLAIGQVSDPVETTFGWHVIVVRSRGVASFEDVRDQIVAQLEADSQNALNDLLAERLQEVDVEVNPKYGTFDASGLGTLITPPVVPQPSDGPPSGPLLVEPGVPQFQPAG
jgi:hypothetical protein